MKISEKFLVYSPGEKPTKTFNFQEKEKNSYGHRIIREHTNTDPTSPLIIKPKMGERIIQKGPTNWVTCFLKVHFKNKTRLFTFLF